MKECGLLCVALLGGWRRYRVDGDSMSPVIRAGDFIWVDSSAYRYSRPRPGDIVVARHPYRADLRLVKRVVRASGDYHLYLRGDNPEKSTDSRLFGALPASLVIGQVRLGLRPAAATLYSDPGSCGPSMDSIPPRTTAD